MKSKYTRQETVKYYDDLIKSYEAKRQVVIDEIGAGLPANGYREWKNPKKVSTEQVQHLNEKVADLDNRLEKILQALEKG